MNWLTYINVEVMDHELARAFGVLVRVTAPNDSKPVYDTPLGSHRIDGPDFDRATYEVQEWLHTTMTEKQIAEALDLAKKKVTSEDLRWVQVE